MTDKYFWNSDDSCERCAVMTGEYEHPPERPHPNCDCDVVSMYDFGKCFSVLEIGVGGFPEIKRDEVIDVPYTVFVKCAAGEEKEITGTMSVLTNDYFVFDVDQDIIDFEDMQFITYDVSLSLLEQRAIDEAHEEAERFCICTGV